MPQNTTIFGVTTQYWDFLYDYLTFMIYKRVPDVSSHKTLGSKLWTDISIL